MLWSNPSKVRMTVDGDVLRLVTFANLSVLEFALLKMLMISSGSVWSFCVSGWEVMKDDHFGRAIVV